MYLLSVQSIARNMEQVFTTLLLLLLRSSIELSYGVFDTVMSSITRVTHTWAYYRDSKIVILPGLFCNCNF